VHSSGKRLTTRREFLASLTAAAGALSLGDAWSLRSQGDKRSQPRKGGKAVPIRVRYTNSNFEREPLVRPFGFKGGYMTEIWQTAVLLESDSGAQAVGLCTQNVLWSDAQVFSSHAEAAGNALMYAVTERALQMVKDTSFQDPLQLLDHLLPELYTYAKQLTNCPQLRMTFVLNALVGVDNASWLLYAAENGISQFDELIPSAYRPALAQRHRQVASIPLISYSVPVEEIVQAVRDGYFFLKIKIGQPGTQQEMLRKDMERIEAIHRAIGHFQTEHTASGKIPYYFDANGRYESKETLLRLLDFTKRIGAFDQIAIIEEPFPEELELDVQDIPVRLAADESAHTDKDAEKRIQMGYRAIALKPIAKTLSMSLRIAHVAHQHHVPCFCADLTVNPILVEWNKNVAARLAPFPGLGLGLLETNGHQNYRDWDRMRSYHPCPDAPWTRTERGLFHLDEDFYRRSGCIFERPTHYFALVKPPSH
jgi:L-alanine-DL-glutamate epimerase-like enolase superfamily enzyme